MVEQSGRALRDLVADVAAAYFAQSAVPASDVGGVIKDIAAALNQIGGKGAGDRVVPFPSAETPRLPSEAQIRQSIRPDCLISFEDGKPYRLLRRHLRARGLTPQQYRAKWGLPPDYPMVAPTLRLQRIEQGKARRRA
jgi:predicted transcriptional regulator